MKTTHNNMPIVTCPSCDEEFQLDDYYDIATGTEFDCSVCETPLEVLSVDTTIECRIGVKDAVGKTEVQK